MSLMTTPQQNQLAKLTMEKLEDSIKVWKEKKQIILLMKQS